MTENTTQTTEAAPDGPLAHRLTHESRRVALQFTIQSFVTQDTDVITLLGASYTVGFEHGVRVACGDVGAAQFALDWLTHEMQPDDATPEDVAKFEAAQDKVRDKYLAAIADERSGEAAKEA